MPSGRLHLKRTPAEEAERALRKARKAARKAAKRRRHDDDDDGARDRSPKRPRADNGHAPTYGDPDSDAEYGPQPPGAGHAEKPDYDRIRAEVEEARFREKMWGAYGDDERLDSVEASLNAYAHVPRRWRGGGMDRLDDELDVDPQFMQDEDYAEWVRTGMWRKKHAAEHEEQMRREAERRARVDREKALLEETARLERAAQDDRRRRRHAQERERTMAARERYDSEWKALLAPADGERRTLMFKDIPWPVFAGSDGVTFEGITAEAISAFIFLPVDDKEKDRKEQIRETMLRFHPDKFEGRIMTRVAEPDKERVQEAVGIVVRALNSLMR